MGRRRSAWLGLAGWLVASCTYTPFPAESTAAACFNNEDDDHDGRMNCADPDCWHLAYCQPTSDGGTPLGPTMPPAEIPVTPDDPLVPMDNQSMGDGSMPIDMPVTDASTHDMPDSSVDAELPAVCSEYCPPGQCSEDGSCNKPLVFGEYDVQGISLNAPRASNNVCFDLRAPCTWLPGMTCCLPDPIVTIYVAGEKAGFVPATADSEIASWASVDMQLELREGDEVRFKVEDEDTFAVYDGADENPQLMFECSAIVTTEVIERGVVGCAPVGSFQPASEDYVVAATIARIGDIPDDEDHEGEMP